jgi:hypothetical protein
VLLGDDVYDLCKLAVLHSRGDMGYEITQDASSLAYDNIALLIYVQFINNAIGKIHTALAR